MNFLEKLNKLMQEKGINKNVLSKESGIPYTTIDGIYKKGYENIKLSTIKKIANYFNTTIDYLMIDDETSKSLKENNQSLTTDEFCHIKKYRELDSHGKKMVDFTLNEEYERCMLEHKQEEKNSKPPIFIFRHFNANRASAGFGYDLQNDDIWQELAVVDTPEARQADFAVEIEGRSMEPTYKDGDIVYIVIASEVPIGKIGLFTQNGKGYIKEAGESYLISHNPDFPNIYPSDGKIECVGRVIGVAELPD